MDGHLHGSVTASGGVCRASAAQSEIYNPTDDPSQISEIFGMEVSKVLQSIDDTWDIAVAADIAEEFTDLQDSNE